MPERFTLAPFEYFVLRARTRFPFRYGIASMTDVPHVFMQTRIASAGRSMPGIAAEGLPPKWFTKDPATTFEQDLPDMLRSVRHAAARAEEAGTTATTFFDLWQQVQQAQEAWAAAARVPPLLASFGVSLVERAVLDGLCRLVGQPLHHVVATGGLGLRLHEVRPDRPVPPLAAFLQGRPLERCHVRHTVGLGDPLEPADIPPAERLDDGLPQDLESSIRAYGLRYFKIKLTGTADIDRPRLERLERVLRRETGGGYHVTLDGNENFVDFDAFRGAWEAMREDAALRPLCDRALVVEQPVHRGRALDPAAGEALRRWPGRPPIIIDESDGALADLPAALDLGYAGTSHKNCKGIVKGLANAALLAAVRARHGSGILTGEDLCTLGPVALLQDLAMMALLQIGHVERNGHHYYRGLSRLPRDWQEGTVRAHGDCYRWDEAGFARVRIAGGELALGSVNAAPFGVGFLPDLGRLERLDVASLT